MIADISGLDLDEIKDNSGLDDLSINSLAGMEMRHEIKSNMKMKLPESEILSIVDMPGLLKWVAGAMRLNMTETSISTAHSQPRPFHGPIQKDEFIQRSDSGTIIHRRVLNLGRRSGADQYLESKHATSRDCF